MARNTLVISICSVLLLVGCLPADDNGNPPAEDGSLTVVLTDADAIDGKDLLGGLFDADADPLSDPLLAVVDFTVSGGGGSDTMSGHVPPYETWVGTGGSSYDVYVWVDMNGNFGTVQHPEPGVDMQLSDFPVTVEIDGDTSVEITFADFTTLPPLPKEDGTLTVVLTDADAIDGKDVLGGLFDADADPFSDPILAGVDFTVSGGGGSDIMEIMDPPFGTWVGTGGDSYDVYLWVDMNGNRDTVQYPEAGEDMQLSDFPVAVEIDGDTAITFTLADFVTVLAPKEDGTLTVVLTDAGGIEGKDVLGAPYDAGADPYIATYLAVVDFTVSGGSGIGTAWNVEPPNDNWIGTGGSSYDLYLWVDMNGNRDTLQSPESGVDLQLSDMPLTVEIDGNTTVALTLADFVTAP